MEGTASQVRFDPLDGDYGLLCSGDLNPNPGSATSPGMRSGGSLGDISLGSDLTWDAFIGCMRAGSLDELAELCQDGDDGTGNEDVEDVGGVSANGSGSAQGSNSVAPSPYESR